MSYTDRIPSILNEYDPTQQQVEALIDAMTLAMVSEGEVPDKERRELEEALDQLDRQDGARLERYVESSLEASREVIESNTVRERVASVSDQLDDDRLREEAYFLGARITAIDAEVVSDETDVLTTFVDVFEIPRDRLKLLTRKLRTQL